MKNHRMEMTTDSPVSVIELSRQIESLVIFRNSVVISRFKTCCANTENPTCCNNNLCFVSKFTSNRNGSKVHFRVHGYESQSIVIL